MPPRHPLFKIIPPRELIFGIFKDLGLHIGHVFTRDSFDIDKAVELVGTLRQYYFDCKSADLFTNINEKRLITILRQCFKVHGYTLKGRETTRGGQKVIQYTVSKEDDSILEEPIIISFD